MGALGLLQRSAHPSHENLLSSDSLSDPENMLVMLQTWQTGDCSQQEPYHGDFERAMRSIKAKTLVLPAKTDLYFPWVF